MEFQRPLTAAPPRAHSPQTSAAGGSVFLDKSPFAAVVSRQQPVCRVKRGALHQA